MFNKRSFSLLALVAMLAGCSGYHGAPGALPAAPPNAALSDAGTVKGSASLLLGLRIPPRPKHHGDYISPSTQSIQVKEGKTTLGTFNTTPTSKGCLQQNGTTVCRFVMGAIPGKNQTFYVSIYDGGGATGNVLATAKMKQTISASKANAIAITLGGVPKTLALQLSNSNPTEGTAADLTLTITAQDADGNTIVAPGNYAFPITLNDSNNGVATLAATTVTSPSGNAVTVHYTGATGSATFTASAKGVQNVTATLQSVKPHSNLIGGIWAAMPNYGSIPYYSGSASPSLALNGGALTSATALTVDEVGGVIGGDANGNIAHWPIDATNTVVPSQSLTGAGQVTALAWDAQNGRIIYAAANAASFCVVSASAAGALGPGNQTCYGAPTYPLDSTVSGLAVDPNTGTLYVANATPVGSGGGSGNCPQNVGTQNCVNVLVFTLQANGGYNFDHFIDIEDSGVPGQWWNVGQIVFDPTYHNPDGSVGNLWVANATPTESKVAGLSSSSTGTDIPNAPTIETDSNVATPFTVAMDGSGGVWIGDQSTGFIEDWTNAYSGATRGSSYDVGISDHSASPTSIAVFNVYATNARRRVR